jgi:hypothetical protein
MNPATAKTAAMDGNIRNNFIRRAFILPYPAKTGFCNIFLCCLIPGCA